MRRIEGITKHTLNLFEGDYARIQELFPDEGAALVIRRIVRRFLEQVDNEARLPLPTQNLEIKL